MPGKKEEGRSMKKIVIGSDKSGFMLKEALKKHLREAGYEVSDCGTQSEDAPLMYDLVAQKGSEMIARGEFEKGIFICGTGMGMAVVANKRPGVYAAVCENTFAAQKARAINDANVLTMGAWITGEVAACAIVDAFLETEFTQGLEDWRAANLKNAKGRIAEFEKELYK